MLIRSLRSLFCAASVAVLLLSGSTAIFAQANSQVSSAGLMPVPSRITAKIDNAKRVSLAGTVHPLARAGNDRGLLDDATPLNRIHVVLKRSDAQETALKQLINDMHDPSSPSYHKWLTPDQFGKQFGPSDEDIAAVQTWLTSQGFTVGKLNPGHQTLEISGNAGTFKKAFNAEIHEYQVNGETHYANSSAPDVPAALAPVFGGFASLNNFRLKSYAKALGEAKYDTATKKVSPTWTEGLNGVSFVLSPADYAVQYDLPAASTGATGAGQTIAIINESNINVYLVNQFRSLFGLPVNPPQIIVDGQDPGVDGINNIDGPNGASVEAYLDVEWAGATAPNATIDLVIGADTELESGLTLAAERAVYSNLAPIMSISFGECEKSQGTGNAFFNSLWQQAAAQGITVLVSSGDNGSAGCDDDNTQQYAVFGQAVNGLASTPYNVAVGGTDFYYSAYNQGNTALSTQLGTYWNTTASNTTPTVSIKGVIPEQPWNDSQYGLNAYNSYTSTGQTNIAGGSGGASTCGNYSLNTSTNTVTCTPYAKPSWQTGTGVPADGARDLPDVSLFAANGNNYSFYPICATDGDCQPASAGGEIQIFGVGGTSASTPAFAGMMALVNQKYGRQGQANYTLYPLAAQFPSAFHDVTVGTNSVPCGLSTASRTAVNCIPVSSPVTVNDSTYGTATEGQIGTGTTPEYNATVGYDLASGLGTIDASVMLANWNKITFAASTTTLTPSTTSFAHGTAVTISGKVTGSGTPSGTVALMTDSNTPLQQAQVAFPLVSGSYSQSINYLPGGTYNIYGQYSGDGVNAASTSAKTAITVTPESAGIALNVITNYINTSGNYSTSLLSAGGSVQYGQAIALSALIAPTAQLTAYTNCVFGSGTCPIFGTATGSVSFADNSTAVNTVQLDAEGEAELNYAPAVGSHSTTAAYSGDASYNSVTSSAFAYTVTKNTPTLALKNYVTANAGQQNIFTLLVENSVSTTGLAAAPTGTITISGGPAGFPTSVTLASGVDPSTGAPLALGSLIVPASVPAGTYSVSITYPGDGNYNSQNISGSLTISAAGTKLASTTTGTVSASSSTPAVPVQLNVTVAGQSGKAAPTGTVYAIVGKYTIATITLVAGSSSSTGSATLSSQDIFQGSNVIALQYVGDTNYQPSAGTVSISNNLSDFTINPVATNVSIPATPGTVTDTVNVTSTNGFTGSVALSCTAAGGVTCSLSPTSVTLTSGQTLPVTLTLNGAAVTTAGTYNVSITGSDATSKYVHVVGLQVYSPKIATSADFTLAAASSSLTVAVPNTATDVITVGSTNSFNSAVAMTCAAPAGVTCSLSPTPVTPASGGTTTSTLSVTGVTAGTYSVVVTGTSGTLVHTATVSVTVTAAPDFTLSAASSSVSVTAPNTATDVITVGSVSTFSSAVAMTCSAPSGVTCSLAPTPVTPTSGGTTTSTLTVTGVTAGTYTVVVTGTSGTLVHTVNVTVTVAAAPTPDFSLAAASTAVSIVTPNTATDVITVGSVNSFSSAVGLTCTGAAGVTCSLAPIAVTPASGGTTTSTLTLTSVAAGTYTVVVTGTSGTLTHSVSIQVTVTNPDFTISAASSTAAPVVGGTATDVITVGSVNTFSKAVALTCAGPAGVTCSLNPTTVTPASGGSTTSTLTLTGVTPGTYTVVVTGTSGTLVHAVNVTVTVPTPDFGVGAASLTASVLVGGTATDNITVVDLNGYATAVALTCSAPTGVTCSLAPASVNPATGTGTSVLTLTGVAAGSYNVVVTGTSGALTHTVTIAVTVPAPGFTLSASPSSLSVIQGNSGTSSISVTGTNGFASAVALTCSAPSGITCSLAPASVTPGTASVLTMTASATSAKMDKGPGFFGVAGGTALAALVCLLIPGKRRRWPALLAVMLCAAALGLTTGCGGGGSNVQSASYTVTVNGTSGALTGSTSVTLTVTSK